MCEAAKKRFLRNELFRISLGASFQTRGRENPMYIYRQNPNVPDAQRLLIRNSIKEYVSTQIFQYNYLTVPKYISSVNTLSEHISGLYKDYLHGERFRIGVSQKLFGLYLKYLWMIGDISEPPVCPFDGEILRELGIQDNWTQIDDIKILKKWIDKAKEKATSDGYNGSIAQWELANWEPENQ